MAERYRSIVDLYVLLCRGDGRVLLLERAGTGFADGRLCPPSGHLEDGESVTAGAIREAREEVGVDIDPGELRFVHAVHHRTGTGQGRIGLFFQALAWRGEPSNEEPDKCARLTWADPEDLPGTTVPYTAAAIEQINRGARFSLDGW